MLGARKEALDRAFNLVATSGALSDGKPTMSLTSFVAVMGFADQHSPTSSLAGAMNHGLSPVRRSPLSLFPPACESSRQFIGSDRCLLGACARLEQADKATLLFGIADTDADEALTLEEFYTVCYLWRYANIRSANQPGQQIVRIDRRWVPSGTAVWFRATVGNTGPEVYSVKGGWERGVLNSNTGDGMVSITARRHDADPPRSASLQQSLLSGVHRLNLVEVPEAEVRIVRWSHPVLAAEEILEQRLQPPWTRSSVRSFDLLMSVCVLLNLVQLGFTAATKTRTTGLTFCALLLLGAFCIEVR